MFPLQLLKAVIMARKSKRAALVLTAQQRASLKELAASRSAATREVERAKVMLGYADGLSVTELQRQLGFSRPMIYRCVDKALAARQHRQQVRLANDAGWAVDLVHRDHHVARSPSWILRAACGDTTSAVVTSSIRALASGRH